MLYTQNFIGADFHCNNLHSLDVISDITVKQEDLLNYFEIIKSKTTNYLENLTEDMLNEVVADCDNKSRF